MLFKDKEKLEPLNLDFVSSFFHKGDWWLIFKLKRDGQMRSEKIWSTSELKLQ